MLPSGRRLGETLCGAVAPRDCSWFCLPHLLAPSKYPKHNHILLGQFITRGLLQHSAASQCRATTATTSIISPKASPMVCVSLNPPCSTASSATTALPMILQARVRALLGRFQSMCSRCISAACQPLRLDVVAVQTSRHRARSTRRTLRKRLVSVSGPRWLVLLQLLLLLVLLVWRMWAWSRLVLAAATPMPALLHPWLRSLAATPAA